MAVDNFARALAAKAIEGVAGAEKHLYMHSIKLSYFNGGDDEPRFELDYVLYSADATKLTLDDCKTMFKTKTPFTGIYTDSWATRDTTAKLVYRIAFVSGKMYLWGYAAGISFINLSNPLIVPVVPNVTDTVTQIF